MSATVAALATRHACMLTGYGTGPHTQGSGQPQRRRCAYCGGKFYTVRGVYGVFAWTGTGRYPLADAVSTHTRESSADRRIAADTTGTLVVRWVSA